jgi:glycosyltransferase involved in cell wall biosynthesis
MAGTAEVSLVSCIMPTYNRRLFVPQAIQYFLRQDYPNKELVIVDDGSDAVADLIPPHAQIRYVRLNQKVSIGTKRNMAVEQSKGKIIVHWDDDDWYATNRISYQVEPLLAKKAKVCGLETGFIYDLLADTFWSCDADLHAMMFYADIHGGSIVYTREVWEKYARYPDASLAEDAAFLRAVAHKVHIIKLPNHNVFIYLRHNSNAWEFICGNFINPSAWKRIPPPVFLSEGDLQFYHDVLAKLLLDANTHKAKGDSFRYARRYEEALQCYERALDLDPTHVWAWYDKGQTLEKLGQYDQALQAVCEADRLLRADDGNRTWIHSELGTLFRLLKDRQQAKHQFETALRYNTRNRIARDGLRRL